MQIQEVLMCVDCGINCDLFNCVDERDEEVTLCRNCFNSLTEDDEDIDEEDITFLDLLED